MSLTLKAASGTKWNGLALGSRAVLQMGTLAVLGRLLTPADFGLMGMATVVTGFVQALDDLGVTNAMIHKQSVTRQQLSSLYWFNVAFGCATCLLVWGLTPLAVAYYREPALGPVLGWSAVALLVSACSEQFNGLLRRDLRFRTRSLIQMLNSVCYSLAAIALALVGCRVMSLVWANLIGLGVSLGVVLVVAARSHWLPLAHFHPGDLRGFLRFGMYQTAGRALQYLSRNIDYLIIGRLLGAGSLGYYTLAYNLMRLPMGYINPLITTVAFPVFARVRNDTDVLRQGYIKLLRYLGSASLPVMAGMFAVAPVLVPVVYGPQWLPAVPTVRIFCLLGAILSLTAPLESLLLAKGKPNWMFYMSLLSIPGYGISNWIGARWGIAGVATSSVVFALAVLLPLEFYLRWRLTAMNLRDYWHALQNALVATAVLVAVVLPLPTLLSRLGSQAARLFLVVIIGVFIYGSALWFLDRHFVLEAWRYLMPACPLRPPTCAQEAPK